MFSKNFVSIELGTQNIKIVAARGRKGTVRIRDVFMINTPEGTFMEDGSIDQPGLHQVLSSALRLHGIRKYHGIITVNSLRVPTREVMLPQVKPDEMKALVEYEIKQHLPIDSEHYVIQYKSMKNPAESSGPKQRVMVAALPKELVELFLSELKALDQKPLAMDLNFNGLAALINEDTLVNGQHGVANKTVGFLDLGHNSIGVSIFTNGVHGFSRTIDDGCIDIDLGISETLDVSMEDAAEKKHKVREFDLSEEVGNAIYDFENSIRMIADTWVFKIQRIFQFFESRNLGGRVEVLYLYGGGAGLGGLSKYFSSAFGIPVEVVQSISGVTAPQGLKPEDFRYYMNAIGAIAASR